ncbi:arylamine N-acetyltransferase family protein [Streptomyces avidinii]|uniref:N-hydroxyarylamine O-acetyltransferase n=1 Tax=Streptomyces avidinii TaxID=1895 RepID=A0ABS4L753_STRAV|nr:arylamine N-acetyltransferase [Streptomyces avidinii]MBP2037930.1 N-hydroxyarylamine O-acetyltransferase [Streptomyces avidinii]
MEDLPASRVDAYLRRIGAERPVSASAAALRDLHLRHLRTVPFESLSIHLGQAIVLEPAALLDKLFGGRGGFCYELNGAFALLLRSLGYRVELLQARVYAAGGGPGIPYDHLALRVECEEGRAWLVDVGFGDHSHFPLALDERGEQPDPGGVFRIGPADGAHGDLDVVQDGVPQYRLEARPRLLADFVTGAWWHSTSPASGFTRKPVCSLLTETGRITLGDRVLTVTDAGERTERTLDGDAEVLAAYRVHFGIDLPRVPVPLHPRP